MAAPQTAGLVAVSEAAFHQLAAPPEQALAVAAAHPLPIPIHRLLLLGLTLPVALPLLLLLRDVTAHLVTLYPLDHCSAVVALIRDQLFDPVDVDLGLTSD